MFDEDEISPEEIFNMFFFGVPPRGGRAAGRGASNNVFSFQRASSVMNLSLCTGLHLCC
jgi:hypothetical protein